MIIASGTPEDHPTPLALDASGLPAVAPPTPTAPSGPEQGGVRDLTGERLSQLAASEAECAAAQSYGMAADAGRRTGYAASTALGAAMSLPPVPDNAVPPAMSDLYPFAGMEPTPAAAGWDYTGSEPGG